MNIIIKEIYICALMGGMTITQTGNEMMFMFGFGFGDSKCLKIKFDEYTADLRGERCIVGLDLTPIFAPGVLRPVDFTSVWSEKWEDI